MLCSQLEAFEMCLRVLYKHITFRSSKDRSVSMLCTNVRYRTWITVQLTEVTSFKRNHRLDSPYLKTERSV
jgi:hypothetical protein